MTSVDISETVIKQMTELHQHERPQMKFCQMDLLATDFADSSFSCFLDKGTLDALMSDQDLESAERAVKMFKVILVTVDQSCSSII